MDATFVLYIGFILAGYSVIGNDVIQTLGTFISSNHKKHWTLLWSFAAAILAATVIYGWLQYNGDVSYGRLSKISYPEGAQWWYLLAPLSLLIITRFGIPVSTTFLILSVFSDNATIEKMVLKSVYGYALAFVSAVVLYYFIAQKLETKESLDNSNKPKQKKYWSIAQWISTGFLWSQWLIQDFANIYVFLPRAVSVTELIVSLVIILSIMAFIFKNKGGKIQEIVNQKSNTRNIRSATIIDLTYASFLFFYGNLNHVPMSTTWVFIGILAGREVAIHLALDKKKLKGTYKLIIKDLAKVNIGLVVSVLMVYIINWLKDSL